MLSMVIGESGTGKSFSVRNLPPESTIYVSSTDKGIERPNWYKDYKVEKVKVTEGSHYFITDSASAIRRIIEYVNEEKPEIKTLIIDDFQYVMVKRFLKETEADKENRYNKFTDIARLVSDIMMYASNNTRRDLCVFILAHATVDDSGKIRMKTVGKMVDDKITPEGLCSSVFCTQVMKNRDGMDDGYYLLTQTDGVRIAKSPYGLFPEFIPNDLKYVRNQLHKHMFGEDLFKETKKK